MSTPIQPVTLTLADLTAIKADLTGRARWLHAEAATARAWDQAPLIEAARHREDVAARLSFARPGEPIQVVAQ